MIIQGIGSDHLFPPLDVFRIYLDNYSQYQYVSLWCLYDNISSRHSHGRTYTQKKKVSQKLCFLIKSTILDISFSNFIHALSYHNFTCTCYCEINYVFIRLHQPNFNIHDVHVLR